MTDEVLALPKPTEVESSAAPNVIQFLELLLADAKRGELVAFGVAYVRRGRGRVSHGRAWDKANPPDSDLAAAIGDLWFSHNDERQGLYHTNPDPLPDGLQDNT